MNRIIKKVAVLGSGVMGSRIACHFAGVGLQVLLLDIAPTTLQLATNVSLTRTGEVPLYELDDLVRRAQPLQEVQILMEGELDVIRLHPDTANKLGLKAGDMAEIKQGHAVATMSVRFDERLAKDTAWIAGGMAASSTLGDLIGTLEVSLC